MNKHIEIYVYGGSLHINILPTIEGYIWAQKVNKIYKKEKASIVMKFLKLQIQS